MKVISIDPITRLEGHGKIEIFVDEESNVTETYFQISELRGFEVFSQGRPVEDMPAITSRICGVCPEAHLMASAKTCDEVYSVTIPPAAKLLREMIYSAFFVGDHTTHFYALGGPDFILGPDASKEERNILGVAAKVGIDIAGKVIKTRRLMYEVMSITGGKTIHPCSAIPGSLFSSLSPRVKSRKNNTPLFSYSRGHE